MQRPSTVFRVQPADRLRTLLAALILAGLSVSAQQSDDYPKLEQRVTDFTNTLSYAEWNALERETKAFEDTTSNQLVILIVESTGESPIEDYAARVFEKNRIGVAGKDNGVLMVVALQERKVRIEVGYGLEGVLTDAVSRQIIEREMKPKFRDEQYFAGLIGGVYAVAGAVAGEYTVDDRGEAAPAVGAGLAIALFLFVFLFLRPLLASRRRSVLSPRGHVYYSGWGWGGGRSGGGGFGGFSGGGGLSGGGGATGSW